MARLKRERVARGLTQADVSARTGLGQSTLSGWESGGHHPTLPLLDDYLAAFGLCLDVVPIRAHPPIIDPAEAARLDGLSTSELLAEVIEALAGLFPADGGEVPL
jgi:transcriptional regulator with XRE-family HTH domain